MLVGSALDRQQLLAWLGGKLTPNVHTIQPDDLVAGTVDSEKVLLLWQNRPESGSIEDVAPIICVPGDFREFFAFVATYVATYQPFSAFFRVIPIETASLLLRPRSVPKAMPTAALVGAVLGEAVVQIGGQFRSFSDLSIQTCLATTSVPFIAGLRLGLHGEELEDIGRGWIETRREISSEELALRASESYEFWRVVSEAIRPDVSRRQGGSVARFVREALAAGGEITPNSWSDLVQGHPALRGAPLEMSASREDRVRLLDRLLPIFRSDNQFEPGANAAILGYLGSCVAGGSMSYINLLDGIRSTIPAAALWFGFFCGAARETDVLSIGECVGRQVSRRIEAFKGLFDRPDADISVGELRTLSVEGLARFRTEQAAVISVEVFPSIVSVFRAPREWRGQDNRENHVDPEALHEARLLTSRLLVLLSQLAEPEQRDLFEGRKSGPRSPRARK